MPDLSSLGNFLTGLAACCVAFYGRKEWSRWKKKEITKKRIEVISNLLLTLNKLHKKLFVLQTFSVLDSDPIINENISYADNVRNRFRQRVKQVEEHFNSFDEACLMAKIYLPEKVAKDINGIQQLIMNLLDSWNSYTIMIQNETTRKEAAEAQKQVFDTCKKLSNSINELQHTLTVEMVC